MSLCIAGAGWITPLGRGIDHVWEKLEHGDEASAQSISAEDDKKTYSGFLVPEKTLKDLPPHPRLRRASAISRFAAAAGMDAIAQAQSTTSKIDMARVALIFAASNGGVIYTRRFYHTIVESGAQSASPILFPETVFNAPASHLAAILGINGASYTIVGDGAVGILAIKMASDLLETQSADFCLVVAAEEADWILCDAYRKWRLLKSQPPIVPFRDPPCGTILSEGAGALLLAREGFVSVASVHAGGNFLHRRQANRIVGRILHDLRGEDACIIASANGTFVDLAEREAIRRLSPGSIVYSPKPALGESVGASAIWQIIVAAQALEKKRLPPLLHSNHNGGLRFPMNSAPIGPNAIVLSCGLNQQAAGLRLSAMKAGRI
jgi:3-oxoacyl-(acyl-carrier-protein) synthase